MPLSVREVNSAAILAVQTRIAVALEAIAAGLAGGDVDVPDALGNQLVQATTDLTTGTDALQGAVDTNSST